MTTAEDAEWVWLARIRRPQGRKGEVFADILTDFPEKFAQRRRLWLLAEGATHEGRARRTYAPGQSPAVPREVELSAHWLHKGGVVLHFAGVDSISSAETLNGLMVAVPLAERAELGEDEVYIADLIGCSLVDVAWPGTRRWWWARLRMWTGRPARSRCWWSRARRARCSLRSSFAQGGVFQAGRGGWPGSCATAARGASGESAGGRRSAAPRARAGRQTPRPRVVRVVEQAAGAVLRAGNAFHPSAISASATPKLSNSPEASLPSTPGIRRMAASTTTAAASSPPLST
jgi:ribosomal 30S subunit maturation factor RimM